MKHDIPEYLKLFKFKGFIAVYDQMINHYKPRILSIVYLNYFIGCAYILVQNI